jgi:hypothetical protein
MIMANARPLDVNGDWQQLVHELFDLPYNSESDRPVFKTLAPEGLNDRLDGDRFTVKLLNKTTSLPSSSARALTTAMVRDVATFPQANESVYPVRC